MTWFGWDASDFDGDRGPMDIGSAVRDGISFFTHKATEGTRTVHRNYRTMLERARDSGMPYYGAYMVPRTPGNNGHGSTEQQVAYFVAYLDQQTPWWRTDPRFRILQGDTEHWGYDDVSAAVGARACELLSRYGKWVPHYAPRWAYGDGIPGADPLWASAYGSNPAMHYREAYPGDGSSVWAPYSGRTPAIVQYGSKLTIGSQPGCDGNAIKDPAVWAALTGGSPEPIRKVPSMLQVFVPNEATIVLTDFATWHRRLPFEALEPMRMAGMLRVPIPAAEMTRILALPQPPLAPAGAPTDAQFAELKAATVAAIPTAASMVDELVRRAKPVA